MTAATLTRQRTNGAVIAPPLRAAIYCRISENRDGEGDGTVRQEALCRELADKLAWDVEDRHVLVDDDASAYNRRKRRPNYEQLLRLIEHGEIDAVLAVHTDRLYRRLSDLTRLTNLIEDRHIEVRTIASGIVDLSTASGRFSAQILGAAGEYESARIGERVSSKHASNTAHGFDHGGPSPYGYRRLGEGRLELEPAEAGIVRECAERLLAGESLRQLALDLGRRGVPSSRGGTWSPKALKGILTSPRICGFTSSGNEPIAKANWPAIIDRATWERVRGAIGSLKVGPPTKRSLLAGLLRCGICGGGLYGHDRGDVRKRVYRCRSDVPGRCTSGVSIRADDVEAFVSGLVIGTASGANLSLIRAERSVSESHRLQGEVADDEAQLAEFAADLGARRISRGEWIAFRGPVEERLKVNRALLARTKGGDALPRDLVKIDQAAFDRMTFDQRRALISLFIDHITVAPGVPYSRSFDKDRLLVSWNV